MALVKCPECKKDISDSAVSCPNCGYDLQPGKVLCPNCRSSNVAKWSGAKSFFFGGAVTRYKCNDCRKVW